MLLKLSYITGLFAITCLFISCTRDINKTESFKDIFDYYKNREGVIAFSIPPSLIGLILDQSEKGENEMASLMKDLSAFRIISWKDTGNIQDTSDNMHKVVDDFTIRNDFKDFFVARSSEENILIRVKEDNDILSEAIIMFSEKEGLTVIHLRGNIKPENIANLVNSDIIQEIEGIYLR